ncbi:hypothetical protein M378DRAFT_180442 [Amanita muscaria Koide BX008]|uniref:Uncharacterized protein n=1 Tax=Amanita muscaria (strain Koide BX008) TaxID=946122 RepID=A0A0C2SBZ8_AMAMK|nr:hypothetical protein M378DRAFT_180442 [Amanita muscaria Koide BX008]
MSAQQSDSFYHRQGPHGRPAYLNTRPKPLATYANTCPDSSYTTTTSPTTSYKSYQASNVNYSGSNHHEMQQQQLNAYGYDNSDNEMILIGSATHEKLMTSANSAYMQVHKERNNYACVNVMRKKGIIRRDLFRSEIEALKQQLASNSGQITTTTQKNKTEMRQEVLQMAFPIAFNDNLIEELHEHTDYPNVIYWNKNTFNINDLPDDGDAFAKKYRFMEDEDGNHISQRRLDDIRAHLLDAFKVIKREMPSLIVEGWRNVDKELSTTCFTDLQRNFFEFTFCEKDWKANAFLTAWYPTITRVRPRRGVKGKEVDVKREVDIDMTEPASVPIKRAAIPPNPTPGPSKKMKTVDNPVARDVPVAWVLSSLFKYADYLTPQHTGYANGRKSTVSALKPKPKPKTNLTKGPLMSSAVANTAPQALSPLLQDVSSPLPNEMQVPAAAQTIQAPSLAHATQSPTPALDLWTTVIPSLGVASSQALPNVTQAPIPALDAPIVSNQLLSISQATPPLPNAPQATPSPPNSFTLSAPRRFKQRLCFLT